MRKKANKQNIKNWVLVFLSFTPVVALIIGGYIVFREFIQKANENVGITFQEMSTLTQDEKPITLIFDVQLMNDGTQMLLKYDIGNVFVKREYITSEVCINGVFVRHPQVISSENGLSFEVEKPDYLLDNFCVTPQTETGSVSATVPYTEQEMLFKLFDGVDESFFPFDKWSTGSTILWLDIKDGDGKTLSIEPQIISNLVLPDWNGSLKLQPIQITVNGKQVLAYQIDITLHRLLSSRFFSILLIAMSLLAITAILYIKETVTAIELSLAILLGLWGIQGILIPASIQGTTLVHVSIILLYIYLVAIISIRFLFMPTITNIHTK